MKTQGAKFNHSAVEKEGFLNKYFLQLQGQSDFPLTMAFNSLEKLAESTKDEKNLLHFLLEDVIFSSIYASFYEAIFLAIYDNPNIVNKLVDSFENNVDEREQIIARQTEHHSSFVMEGGNCSGCSSCQNHPDVTELVHPWRDENLDYFQSLYLGMQTIQFSMEHLLYDVTPFDKKLPHYLTGANLLSFRRFIYNFVQANLK